MSVQKLRFETVVKKKITFTMIPNSIAQKINDPVAGFIWIYLQSLPETWDVQREHLKNHFNMSDRKLEKCLRYLSSLELIRYIRQRNDKGEYINCAIEVLCGIDLSDNGEQLQQSYPQQKLSNNEPEKNEDPSPERVSSTGAVYDGVVKCARGDDSDPFQITNTTYRDIYNTRVCARSSALEKFEKFWSLYPRKQNKKNARKIWFRDNLDAQFDLIMPKLRDQVKFEDQWRDPQYIPLASTYLQNERWEDEIRNKQLIEAQQQAARAKAANEQAQRILEASNKAFEEKRSKPQEKIPEKQRMAGVEAAKSMKDILGYRNFPKTS